MKQEQIITEQDKTIGPGRHYKRDLGVKAVKRGPGITYKNSEAMANSAFDPDNANLVTETLLQNINIAQRERLGHGEDNYAIVSKYDVAAVFDGAGGHEGGGRASELAAEVTKQFPFDDYDYSEGLAECLKVINETVVTDEKAGITTGTMIRVVKENGEKVAYFASAGDSRFYIINEDGDVEQITKDEGGLAYNMSPKAIANWLGKDEGGLEGLHLPSIQSGMIPILGGDYLVLVTDGVTGDVGDDIMSNSELMQIVVTAKLGNEAQALVDSARKNDDRTAIVIKV